MEPGVPVQTALVLQPHELVTEGHVQVDAVAVELDVALLVDTANRVLRRVAREAQRRGPVARLVDLRRWLPAESIMRAHVVEIDQPAGAVVLLRATKARRR